MSALMICPRVNPLTNLPTRTRPTDYSKGPWEVVECVETGMVFLANPPKYEDLEDTYSWDSTFEQEARRRREKEPILSRISQFSKFLRRRLRRQERVAKTVTRLLSRKAKEEGNSGPFLVLDVGCGTGKQMLQTVDRLREAYGVGVVPVGVEISRSLAKEADGRMKKAGGYCIRASAVEGIGDIEADTLDVVVLSSYLEHEVNPLGVLQAVRDCLKPGGYVVIRLPNFDCWNRRLRKGDWCGFRYPDHVNYFTPATLTALLANAGLKVHHSPLLDRMPTNDNLSLVATK